jgi:hypothetical protein
MPLHALSTAAPPWSLGKSPGAVAASASALALALALALAPAQHVADKQLAH